MQLNEVRWNPLLRQWIIIAGHRGKRPWRPDERGERFCPFCPGAPETKDLGEWDVIVLPNKYPALSPTPPKPMEPGSPLFKAIEAKGICEVLVETPEHEGDLCDLSLEHMSKVINMFKREYERLSSLPFIEYVAEFRNKGKEIGVSLTHPHSQIYALPFIPPRVAAEIESFKEYYEKTGNCLLCDILSEERRIGKRIIYENKLFTVLLPYYAMWPYEVHVYPRKHLGSLADFSDEDSLYLGDALRVVTATYNMLFERDMPYIMVFHQSPSKKKLDYYHMHVEFYQPYRDRDKLKYAAGIEWGFGVFTYDGVPEVKAKELRDACKKAVDKRLDKVLGECIE